MDYAWNSTTGAFECDKRLLNWKTVNGWILVDNLIVTRDDIADIPKNAPTQWWNKLLVYFCCSISNRVFTLVDGHCC